MQVFIKGPFVLREWFDRGLVFGNKPFVVYEGERYSFEESLHIAAAFAQQLVHRHSIQKGDRVAIAARNSPEWVFAFMAVCSIGAVVVPLNGWWVGKELAYGLRDSGAVLVIADEERIRRIFSVLPEVPALRAAVVVRGPVPTTWPETVSVASWADEVAAFPEARWGELPGLGLGTQQDDPAIIMYTSGTTGHPKGVVLTHRGVLSMLKMLLVLSLAAQRATPPGVVKKEKPNAMLVPVPLFHVTGTHAIFLASFVTGGHLRPQLTPHAHTPPPRPHCTTSFLRL